MASTSECIHQTLSSISGDRGWRRVGGGPVSITWFLSGCVLTLLSFCVMLTEPWIARCEHVFALVSSHFHTFVEVYMCVICFKDMLQNQQYIMSISLFYDLPSLWLTAPSQLISSVDINLKTVHEYTASFFLTKDK